MTRGCFYKRSNSEKDTWHSNAAFRCQWIDMTRHHHGIQVRPKVLYSTTCTGCLYSSTRVPWYSSTYRYHSAVHCGKERDTAGSASQWRHGTEGLECQTLPVKNAAGCGACSCGAALMIRHDISGRRCVDARGSILPDASS